jgi:DNA-binding transcriptional ArsR family regulator
VAEEGAHSHPVDPERVAAAGKNLPSAEDASELAELFRVLGDPARARIAAALGNVDELCVGDVALTIGASENAVSYALRHLRSAGIVQRRRAGRVIYYRLAEPRVRDLIHLAGGLVK